MRDWIGISSSDPATIRLAVDSPSGSTTRQHLDPTLGIVFAIHPGDGVKVRELPDEQDQEQCKCSSIEAAARRRIADGEALACPGRAPTVVHNGERRLSGVYRSM